MYDNCHFKILCLKCQVSCQARMCSTINQYMTNSVFLVMLCLIPTEFTLVLCPFYFRFRDGFCVQYIQDYNNCFYWVSGIWLFSQLGSGMVLGSNTESDTIALPVFLMKFISCISGHILRSRNCRYV